MKTQIQFLGQTRDLLDPRLRGNDGHWVFQLFARGSEDNLFSDGMGRRIFAHISWWRKEAEVLSIQCDA
jgi:hypothetical protein